MLTQRKDTESSLGGALLVRETGKAILVRLDNGKEQWVPKSVIRSYEGDQTVRDDLIVQSWFAEKEEL